MGTPEEKGPLNQLSRARMNSRSEAASPGTLWDWTRLSILKRSTYYFYGISASYAFYLGSFPAAELPCQASI